MARPKIYTEEERSAKEKESQQKSSRKYYEKNARLLCEKKRMERIIKSSGKLGQYKNYRLKGITMIDTLTGDTFDYANVKECAEDMGTPISSIYESLNKCRPINNYLYKARAN